MMRLDRTKKSFQFLRTESIPNDATTPAMLPLKVTHLRLRVLQGPRNGWGPPGAITTAEHGLRAGSVVKPNVRDALLPRLQGFRQDSKLWGGREGGKLDTTPPA